MSKDHKIYSPSADWTINAHINSLNEYKEIYNNFGLNIESIIEKIKERL